MIQGSLALTLAGEEIHLLPTPAVWYSKASTLLIADLHLGKAANFRRLGLPVPQGTTTDNLERLDRVLTATQAKSLVVLGDFFHSLQGLSDELLARLKAWRRSHTGVMIEVVPGNHDRPREGRSVQQVLQLCEIDCLSDAARLGPFELWHEHRGFEPTSADAGATVLSGHLHPVVWLKGQARERLRLPCFWLKLSNDQNACLVLPSFGEFTGGHAIEWPISNMAERSLQRCFIVGEAVFELPRA